MTLLDHSERALMLELLGASYSHCWHISGSLKDLNSAIEIMCEALDCTLKDHPDYVV